MQLAVIEWNAWIDFLAPAIWPAANWIGARPGQDAMDLVDSVPSGTTHVLYQINLSDWTRFLRNEEELLVWFRARGIKPLNHRAKEISKRHLATNCRLLGLPDLTAERQGDPNQMLFIKTNSNCGGEPEINLSPAAKRMLGVIDEDTPIHGSGGYLVRRRCEIPCDWWDHTGLCIQRLVTNQSGTFRRIYVVGDRLVISESTTAATIKKMGYGLPRTNWYLESGQPMLTTPQNLISLSRRARLLSWQIGMDFGALDVVIDEDQHNYFCDVNPTPYWGEDEASLTTYLSAARL
jgi:hypothetical protein